MAQLTGIVQGFANGTFDVVLASDALDRVTDIDAALLRCKCLLRNGGLLLLRISVAGATSGSLCLAVGSPCRTTPTTR
jgi:2-polyprenyl-3-methyl-5-hydroxy-6-metoxy-1,4-benzoquinol methylase